MLKFLLAHTIIFSFTTNYAHANEIFEKMQDEQKNVSPEVFTDTCYKPGLIRHIVLIRYSPAVTDAQRQAAIERFMSLKETELRDGKPYILDIEYGEQNSGEGADKNYEYAFIVTFKSEGDRNYYVGDPVVTEPQYTDQSVKKFKNFAMPLIDETKKLVFDYNLHTENTLECTHDNILSPQHNIN